MTDSLPSIQWVDKETLAFVDGDRKVFIWIDFDKGFLSNTRLVHRSSILFWANGRSGEKLLVNERERDQIITEVINYYAKCGKQCVIID